MSDFPETLRLGQANHVVQYSQLKPELWTATIAFKQTEEGHAYSLDENPEESKLVAQAGVGADQNEAFNNLGIKLYEEFGDRFQARPGSGGGIVIDG